MDDPIREFTAQARTYCSFIEDAVRWRVFHRTVQDIKAANANTKLDEVQRIVDEAVGEVRAERRAKGRLGEG